LTAALKKRPKPSLPPPELAAMRLFFPLTGANDWDREEGTIVIDLGLLSEVVEGCFCGSAVILVRPLGDD